MTDADLDRLSYQIRLGKHFWLWIADSTFHCLLLFFFLLLVLCLLLTYTGGKPAERHQLDGSPHRLQMSTIPLLGVLDTNLQVSNKWVNQCGSGSGNTDYAVRYLSGGSWPACGWTSCGSWSQGSSAASAASAASENSCRFSRPHPLKGRDGFGFRWHAWLVLCLNRGRGQYFKFFRFSNDIITQNVYFSR